MADLKLAKTTDQEAIVSLLEATLTQAKNGDFKAMMILGVFHSNACDTAWAGLGGMRVLEKVGMLEMMKADLLAKEDD